MNESQTRIDKIDPALKIAGWSAVEDSRIITEYNITNGRISKTSKPKALKADYILSYKGVKLAIVEAKSDEKDVSEGVAQAKLYAEMLDIYMTGLYYTLITKDDVDKATGVTGQRSEAGMDNSLTYCYSVEGGAEIAKEITKGVVPVIGSIYVEQYLGDFTPFGPAVTQALKSTDGVMIFDIVHLNKHKLWDVLEQAMKDAE